MKNAPSRSYYNALFLLIISCTALPSTNLQAKEFSFDIDDIEDAPEAQGPQTPLTRSEKIQKTYDSLKFVMNAYVADRAYTLYKVADPTTLSQKQKIVVASSVLKTLTVNSAQLGAAMLMMKIKRLQTTRSDHKEGDEQFVGMMEEFAAAYFESIITELYGPKRYSELSYVQRSKVWFYFFVQLTKDSLHMSSLAIPDMAYGTASFIYESKDTYIPFLVGLATGSAATWYWMRA
jgi:hypothetical protein